MPIRTNDHGIYSSEMWNQCERREFDYKYPKGLDLNPKGDFHKELLARLWWFVSESYENVSRRFPSWRDVDKKLTAYSDVSKDESDIQKQDRRKPVSIVWPYSLAILETLQAYLATAFLDDPIFSYEYVEPADKINALMMDHVVSLQTYKFQALLPLFIGLKDALSYGIGAVTAGWKKRETTQYPSNEPGENTKKKRKLIFEGTAFDTIDPYKLLLDPRYASHKVQEAEFFGWGSNTDYRTLLREEHNEGELFNVKYLECMKGRRISSIYSSCSESARDYATGMTSSSIQTFTGAEVDRIHLYVDLIPRDWNLGGGEYPEKWKFEIAGGVLIINARKANLAHGMYPVGIASPTFDGYSTLPISKIEQLYGLQHTLDWLMNSRIANVRKTVNNTYVYDPSIIVGKDLKDNPAGNTIRIRKSKWGLPGMIDMGVKQLPITDVTRQNLADTGFVGEFMDRLGGTSGDMMGSLRMRGPERTTSTEVQGAHMGRFNRLQLFAKLMGAQMFQPLGTMAAFNNQQFLTRDVMIKMTGELYTLWNQMYNPDKEPQESLLISPRDLKIPFDVKVKDGSIPGGNFDSRSIGLFTQLQQDPELRQNYDMAKMFDELAINTGLRDINRYRKEQQPQTTPNIKVLPDEVVATQAQFGNLQPLLGE